MQYSLYIKLPLFLTKQNLWDINFIYNIPSLEILVTKLLLETYVL